MNLSMKTMSIIKLTSLMVCAALCSIAEEPSRIHAQETPVSELHAVEFPADITPQLPASVSVDEDHAPAHLTLQDHPAPSVAPPTIVQVTDNSSTAKNSLLDKIDVAQLPIFAPPPGGPFMHDAAPPVYINEPAGGPGSVQMGDGTGTDQFWILSTRHLPHNLSGCPNGINFQFYSGGECGPLQRRDCPSFQQWLADGVPVMIMVHGSFVDWELSVNDARQTFKWMRNTSCGRPVRMVFFSWPSDGPYCYIPTIDVGKSGRRASFAGIYLSQLIDILPPNSPVCMIGHSHGSRVVSSCLHFRSGGEIFGCVRANQYDCRRIRVIFAAAAIDHHWLNPGARFGRALNKVECLVNMQNKRDLALGLYPVVRPFSASPLARSGFTYYDNRVQGQLALKTIDVDVTRDIKHQHTWPYYYRLPHIAQIIAPYVYDWGVPATPVAQPKPAAQPASLSLSTIPQSR